MARYKIYEDEKHHLGLVSEDGKHKTPAVYDEIQVREEGAWYCRAYINWDYFYPCNGTFSLKSRKYWIEGECGKKIDSDNKYTTVEDREVYDSITERKTSRFIFTYENGKFGLKALDGSIILDAIYDDIDVWDNADVIQVRLGDKHLYFNEQKEQILSDEPACKENDKPYWNGMGWHHVMTREIVDRISDKHTYVSHVGLVRIDQKEVNDVARMLVSNCERIPMSPAAIKLFTDRYSYEFGMTIIDIHSDSDGTISEEEWISGIKKLETLGAFGNSWYFIDKFLTNSKTRLSIKSLYWLKHKYDMEYDVLGKLCFAYGVDDSLPDGEVKWIHVEHYNEHCFPKDYGVCNAMQYDTLNELKQRIEAHDWEAQGDPYGGCFFGYRNIRYPKERSWEETEKILNYMYQLGHNPEELIECAVSEIQSGCDTSDELTFWENCSAWALDRCKFPNRLQLGRTCYDEFLEANLESESAETQLRISKLGELFLAHGAMTGAQQAAYNIQRIDEVQDPYDYTLIETW